MAGRPFTEILTPRLRLRSWRDADLAPFAAMNADERVMACFPSTLDRAASDAVARRHREHFDRYGFGRCIVETRDGRTFAGVVGLSWCTFDAPMNPSIEVSWRLPHAQWGKGYATEAARAALEFGFGGLALDRITAFTALRNERSWRVMQRLGMARSPADDFDHPLLPPDSPLRRHVTYVALRQNWGPRTAMREVQ